MLLVSHPDFSYAQLPSGCSCCDYTILDAFLRELPLAKRCLLILVKPGTLRQSPAIKQAHLCPTADWYHRTISDQLSQHENFCITNVHNTPPQLLTPGLGQGQILPRTHPCLAHYSCPFCFSHSIQNPLRRSYFWKTPLKYWLSGIFSLLFTSLRLSHRIYQCVTDDVFRSVGPVWEGKRI